MADRVIQRHDTAARWQQFNPVLASGEIGIITDGSKGYKIGDGKTAWNSLPFPANPTNVVQETGNGENVVMSQKAVSEKLAELGSEVGIRMVNKLRDGGSVNAYSSYKVRTSAIKCSDYNKLVLHTDRPNTPNCEYYYECLFSSDEASIDNFFASNENPSNFEVVSIKIDKKSVEVVSIPNNAVSVTVGIWEIPYNGSEGDIILRAESFSGYSVGVKLFVEDVVKDTIDENINSLKNEVINPIETNIESLNVKVGDLNEIIEVVRPSIYNGTAQNSGNNVCIRNASAISARKGDVIIADYIGNKSDEQSDLYFGFFGCKSTKTSDIGADATEGISYDNNIANKNYYRVKSDSTLYICVNVAEKNANGEWISLQGKGGKLRVSVVDGNVFNNIYEDITGLTNDVLSLENGIEKLVEEVKKINRTEVLSNGGVQNAYNGYKVRTCGLDVRGKNDIIPITDKPKNGNSYYVYEFMFVAEADAIGKLFAGNSNPNSYTALKYYSNKKEGDSVKVPEGASAVVIAVYEIPEGGAEGDIVLRTSNFKGYKIGYSYDVEANKNADTGAYKRNEQKTTSLGAACRQRIYSNTSKDFQMLIITDSHDDNAAVKNAVEMTNGFHTIDCMVHCGDMMGDFLVSSGNASTFINEIGKCSKPWFNVIGNHEAGTYNVVGYVPSIDKMRSVFIQPMIDKGILLSGEYVGDNCYYYHDFSDRKIRMIVLNEYDGDLALDDEYWEAITYDSSYPKAAWSSTHNVGDIINMNYYTEHSFMCKKASTFGSSPYALTGQEPKYKVLPGRRMIGEDQANWFLDKLATTPSDYSVIVVLHNPFSDNAITLKDKVFCENVDMVGASASSNSMETDFIANAVDAFVRGVSYNEKIVYKGNASYRNTRNDGSKNYVYEVSKDFSEKNSNVKFLFYVGGHVHNDLIWKHNTYNQYQVTPICAATAYHLSPNSDIRRSNINDSVDYDSITVVSADSSRKMRLVKLGVDTTADMEKRDVEMIDLAI